MTVERIPVEKAADVVVARQAGRALASRLGFSHTAQTLIATAISEVARNIVEYSHGGYVELEVDHGSGRPALVVTACDRGPGIANVESAMQDGYTTGRGLGVGLPGAKRLMDEFSITSSADVGTTIVMKKWSPGGARTST